MQRRAPVYYGCYDRPAEGTCYHALAHPVDPKCSGCRHQRWVYPSPAERSAIEWAQWRATEKLAATQKSWAERQKVRWSGK